MNLRPDDYKSIVQMMNGSARPGFRALSTAGFNLATGFHALHAQGKCYRDISYGNAFFNPVTGDVLICDNDNVDIEGVKGPIQGTPDFMAPELVRGQAAPNADTDRHSLAVLLFLMFYVHHPLMGRRILKIHVFDLHARRELFGNNPVFIFDPSNDTNRAQPNDGQACTSDEAGQNALTYWAIYPNWFNELFLRAFTVGLTQPHERVKESIWKKALARLGAR